MSVDLLTWQRVLSLLFSHYVSNNVSEGKVVQFLTNIVTAVCFSAHVQVANKVGRSHWKVVMLWFNSLRRTSLRYRRIFTTMKDFHKMPQKDFPDSNTMKDFHKMPQKNFPDSNTMKDFHKMPQKDFPDFTTMKDFHNPESESTFTAFSGFSNHSRILRHFQLP